MSISHQKNLKKICVFSFSIMFFANIAHSQVSGTVFRDFNANGVQETVLPFIEPSLAGITVKAFDAAGAQVGATATTLANGTYSIATGGVAARIEFSGLSTVDFSGPQGTGSNTAVQFVSGADTNVNFGMNYPSDYCQANPKLAVSCFVSGDPVVAGSSYAADPAIVSVNYNLTGKTSMITSDKVGTLWGMAYDNQTDILYMSSFVRRHAAIGPAGLGAIYVYPNANGAGGALTTITVPNVGTIASNSDRELSGSDPLSHDVDGFDKVGKVGLGDMDIDTKNHVLYVVNLNDKNVYKIDLTAALPTAVALPAYTAPSCTNGVFRPFGMKVKNGKIYLGGVCSGETEVGISAANLNATVFAYDITAGTWATVLTFPLDYARAEAYPGLVSTWKPWIDQIADITTIDHTPPNEPFFAWSTPLLSDIEFADDGAMIIGLMDRTGMQIGKRNYGTDVSNTGTLYYCVNGGDIRRATPSGATYTIESGALEFFTGDEFLAPGEEHREVSMGALAAIPGRAEVVMTAIDPFILDSGGLYWLSTQNGVKNNVFEIYGNLNNNFGKAPGLGDVEPLCLPAPIEIGNRIWNDTNEDGIQNANELGIGNVTVELYADFNNDGTPDGAVLATTSSSPTAGKTLGTWYFNATNVADGDPSVAGNQAGLATNKKYLVRIGAADWTGGAGTADLARLLLTSSNAIPVAGIPDVSDNDASLAATIPTIAYTVGNAGENNHTLDFGFIAIPCNIAGTTTVTQPSCANNDGAITLTVTGALGTPTYLWSNGAITKDLSGVGAGDYTVTITEGSCTAIATGSLDKKNVNSIISICPGETYTLSISDNTLTNIAWQKDGANIAGAVNPTYIATSVGIYTYTSNGVGGCSIGQCCPLEIKANAICCPIKVCLPVSIVRNN
jgi:hypothetical protein